MIVGNKQKFRDEIDKIQFEISTYNSEFQSLILGTVAVIGASLTSIFALNDDFISVIIGLVMICFIIWVISKIPSYKFANKELKKRLDYLYSKLI